jgi:hypothetical protein
LNPAGRSVTRHPTIVVLLLLTIGAGACMPPSWAANALLHPQRHPVTRQPNRPVDAVELEGAGDKLKGWWFHAPTKRGTVVVLHGVSDNRASSVGIADHFLARGFGGPKRLIVVPNADRNHVLDAGVWREIDSWLDAALAARAP